MKITAVILFSFITGLAYSQAYLDSIAVESCKCVDNLDLNNLEPNQVNMKVGLCLIEKAMPYKSNLLAENGLNLDELDRETGAKLGKLVVAKMLNLCPEVLGKLGAGPTTQKKESHSKKGKIQEVVENDFVTVTLVDEERMTSKYIWLKNFPGADELSQAKKPKGKAVLIKYEVNEFYDPRIKEYRNFNVITSLEIQD